MSNSGIASQDYRDGVVTGAASFLARLRQAQSIGFTPTTQQMNLMLSQMVDEWGGTINEEAASR